MGQIQTEFIHTLVYDVPEIFIETGTALGGTPQRMIQDGTFSKWKKVYTIELSADSCKVASKRYKLFEEHGVSGDFDPDTGEADETFKDRGEYFDGKLVLVNGESEIVLRDILMNEIDDPCVFWLDAHAGGRAGYAKGRVDVPLMGEFEVIKEHAHTKNIENHVVCIDDVHMLGQKQYDKEKNLVCDWSDLAPEEVARALSGINKQYTVEFMNPFGQPMLTACNKPFTIPF